MSDSISTRLSKCKTSQLKLLLSLACGDSKGMGSLPASALNHNDLSRLLAELCGEGKESGVVLLSTICTSGTPISALEGIKELAKNLISKAQTETHRTAAIMLYHLSIAAALGRHKKNISSRAAESRLGLYEDLATAWAADPIGLVFREAVDHVASTLGDDVIK